MGIAFLAVEVSLMIIYGCLHSVLHHWLALAESAVAGHSADIKIFIDPRKVQFIWQPEVRMKGDGM